MLHFSSRRRQFGRRWRGEKPLLLRASRLYRMSQWVSGPGLHKAILRACARVCMSCVCARVQSRMHTGSFYLLFSLHTRRETDSLRRIYVRNDNGTWWISVGGLRRGIKGKCECEQKTCFFEYNAIGQYLLRYHVSYYFRQDNLI